MTAEKQANNTSPGKRRPVNNNFWDNPVVSWIVGLLIGCVIGLILNLIIFNV